MRPQKESVELRLAPRAAQLLLAVLGDRVRQNVAILRGDSALISLIPFDLERTEAITEEQLTLGILRATIERQLSSKHR